MTDASWCVTQGVVSEFALWHLRFSHQGVRLLTSLGTWCCVIENAPNILKEHGAFIFKGQAVQKKTYWTASYRRRPENSPCQKIYPYTKIQVMKVWAIQQL